MVGVLLVWLFGRFLTRTQVNRFVVGLIDKQALGAYTAR
jgi:hypothetical protein